MPTPVTHATQKWVNEQIGSATSGGGKLLSGTATPPSTLGEVGDFYLQLPTEGGAAAPGLFGPKSGDGWPATAVALGGGSASSPVLTSPNGTRYRAAIADDGSVTYVATFEPGPPAQPQNLVLEDKS